MSSEFVSYYKASNANEGYQIASNFLKSSEAQAKLPVKIDFSFVEGANPKVIGKGKGFEVILCFHDSKVSIDLNLKLMLKPLRNKIINSIIDEIKRVL